MGSHQPASKGIDLCMVFGILKNQNYREKACAKRKGETDKRKLNGIYLGWFFMSPSN